MLHIDYDSILDNGYDESYIDDIFYQDVVMENKNIVKGLNGNGMKTNYQIFVDGSCRANGNGGIGIVWLKNGEKVFEYSKGYKGVTNNIMELKAIGIALKSIKKRITSLTIISDSEYALGCIFNKGWKPKKNVELIENIRKEVIRVQELTSTGKIYIKHVYGHQKGDEEYVKYNNLCDKLAQNESKMIL